MKEVAVIGGGLAGCECAYKLAQNNIKVKLYEMKKIKKTEAHKKDTLAELVCSNSLKSEHITNATGLLKQEMKILGSLIIDAAYNTKVPSGLALAVNRDEFSEYITDKIYNNSNIQVIDKEIISLEEIKEDIIVVATGPLTTRELFLDISKTINSNNLYFYDAAAPIISADSIDMEKAYIKDRYGEIGIGDYLNLQMTKEEYDVFYDALIHAESADKHLENELKFFEGCMPVEELARRGEKTLVFGPLKPVGLRKYENIPPYAVLQLRPENDTKTMYNLVGFQTSLKFKEQERVFSKIPGLENINILRYGVMHKNTYINAPEVLNNKFMAKNIKNEKLKGKDIYFAGQLTGVEGYIPCSASGLMIALNIITKDKGIDIDYTNNTILGALAKHVSTENKEYTPMNANFGILEPLNIRIKDKKLKYEKLAHISIDRVNEIRKMLDKNGIM